MNLLILILSVMVVFLVGAWLLVKLLVDMYGDSTASYGLFAVRDRLIRAVVFDGVDRDDPYFSELYRSVNDVLMHSNLISGPAGWCVAPKVGEYLVANPKEGRPIYSLLKGGVPPQPLIKVLDEMYDALTHMLDNHNGFMLQVSGQRRAERRMQKEEAKRLRDMVDDFRHNAAA